MTIAPYLMAIAGVLTGALLLILRAYRRGRTQPGRAAYSGKKLRERVQFIVEVHPVKKKMTTLAAMMMLAVLAISFASVQAPGNAGRADMDSFVGQFSALVTEKGPMNAWSLADKAMLSDLMEREGVSQPGEPRYTLPGPGDKTEDEVAQLAASALATQYGVDVQALLSGYERDFYFSVYPDYPDDPFWQVDFRLPAQQNPDGVVAYSVTYKPRADEVVDAAWYAGAAQQGGAREEALAALEAQKGMRFEAWPLAEMAAFDREWYGEGALYVCGIPGPEDTQEADAVRLAKEAMVRTFGFADGDMARFDVWRMYLTGDPTLDDASWIFMYVPKGENPGPDAQFSEAYTVLLHGRTGDVLTVFDQAEGSSG